jgi:glycosyltransferase involved in cell wall biosynthesis
MSNTTDDLTQPLPITKQQSCQGSGFVVTPEAERVRAGAEQLDTFKSPIAVSIIIKALNEQANIARAIESALAALGGLNGEVIVADSLSTDQTVAIAVGYPVTVVQLCNPVDRCCGAGPQLGFQYASGEFVYILDGDMELDAGFVVKAIDYLRAHPDVVGVGGIVEELGGGNYEFEARKSQGASWGVPGEQPWLEMGGLYRRDAVVRAGYFSNRNLHAYEEQDLGLRLGLAAGRLVRLPVLAVRHYGRQEASWALMKRRLATRYSDGSGELVRAAIGTPLLWPTLRSQIKLAAMAGLWSWSAIGLLLVPWTPWPLVSAGVVFLILAILFVVRKRSLSQASFGLMNWQLRTLGFVRGLLRPQIPPETWLESRRCTAPIS